MTQMTQINYNLSGLIIKKNPRHLRNLRMKSELLHSPSKLMVAK